MRILFSILLLSSPVVMAEPLTQAELIETIRNQTDLDDRQVLEIVEAIHTAAGNRRLNVEGIMSTSGFNGAFFMDSDYWDLTVTLRDPVSSQLITTENAYRMYYNNGGFKVQLVYKWVIIIPIGDDLNTANLHEAVFDGPFLGRGIGITLNPGLGVDIQYLIGNNRTGSLLIIAPTIGGGAGLNFPQVTFERNTL